MQIQTAEPPGDRDSLHRLRCRLFLFCFFEIGVLENVRSGTDQAETHTGIASIARRKNIAHKHYYIMRSTVLTIVGNFIDSGFAYRASGRIDRAAFDAALVMRTTRTLLVGATKANSFMME